MYDVISICIILIEGGLMDLIGKGCSNETLLHQLFLELRVTWILQTLTRIQKMVKHHHRMMSVGGMNIGRNIFLGNQKKWQYITNTKNVPLLN